MGIHAKYNYLPEKRKWLGVIFEAESADPDPNRDEIVVLTVETADTVEEIRDWIRRAKETHEWETR